MRRLFGALVVFAFMGWTAPDANATAVFTASGGGLSAKAEFTITGTTLEILLTNLDSSVGATNEALTGVFFKLGSSAFTPVSATIPAGSSIVQAGECSTACAGATNVGGEYGYEFNGGWGFAAGANQGVASSGYLTTGLPENFGNFPGGTDLDDPESLDGANFAIVGSAFVPYSGNGGLDNDPLIRSAVKFVLNTGVALSESSISNVYFTYGTSPDKTTPGGTTSGTATTTTTGTPTTTTTGTPTTGSVPEPGILALFGAGLVMASRQIRRRAR